MTTTTPKYTNALIHETSPYLLQHAHNPVNWLPWNDATLEKAKQENKLMLISVGYSACHWCHVMEHQCFENEKVAQIMNDHFICIKVDREERPDIDQVYMMAVQLMTGKGGWPLNCFTLPDGRPVYGGTYFPKEQWINILLNLADLYANEKQKMLDYATQLTEGVKLAELVKINTKQETLTIDLLHKSYANWKPRFDLVEGGPDKAPKFPLPNNYLFLLRYASAVQGPQKLEAWKQFHLTLTKMAHGGIYDQVGGGFSRYSVDHYWKVPHFEKMLYDNAQLVSLYSEAYQATQQPLYKQIVYETLAFVERELTSPEGCFYSALDADSEGEEGKFYIWKREELQEILKDKFDLTADYYNVNEYGLWEDEHYILLRREDDEVIANKHKITVGELNKTIRSVKEQLLSVRNKRIRPGLDDKTLTSWNALMLHAYVDAYNALNDVHFLTIAERNANFLISKQLQKDNRLNHSYKDGKSTINAYLEDYSFCIEAFIALYEATFKEEYLKQANDWMIYCMEYFLDEKSKMFYFTSKQDPALISRKMELADNVTPASNSSMAKALFKLGHHLDQPQYIAHSQTMLNNVVPEVLGYAEGYSNWAMLLLQMVHPFYEISIVGKSVDEKRQAFNKHYLPNKIFAGSKGDSELPLLKGKHETGKTLIYICSNNTCNAPVHEVAEAIGQIEMK
ncbi:MAG TPA: thioredoxin domain-containing protein [Bacteroidia bacterium]|nr:thioredoxin domain-containing protein [Bacteroidia bacterium]